MRSAKNSITELSQFYAERAGFLSQNSQPRLDIRRLQLGGQPPFKTGDETAFEVLNFARRPVAGEDDLFMSLKQRVERMKKLLLRAFAPGEKLDVIDQ